MSAHADPGGVAEPRRRAATLERKSARGDLWLAGGMLAGVVAMYGLFGALIYVAVVVIA